MVEQQHEAIIATNKRFKQVLDTLCMLEYADRVHTHSLSDCFFFSRVALNQTHNNKTETSQRSTFLV